MPDVWIEVDCLNVDGCNMATADEWERFVTRGGWGDGVDATRREVVQAYVQEHGCPDCGGEAELVHWSNGDDDWSAH